MNEPKGLADITIGTRYSFCKHYPNGYAEPFECAECAKEPKTTYTVTKVTKNSIQFSTDGKHEICMTSK